MKIESYNLPEFWACALINGDVTSMTDDDIDGMETWLKIHSPGYCVDVSDEPFFITYHDAQQTVLSRDCLIYKFRQ